MKNDIWTIWGDLNFLIPTLGFIVAIVIALYFECKYLDERKKNQCLMKYAAKPTIAPLKPMSVNQNATDGTCQSGLTPIVTYLLKLNFDIFDILVNKFYYSLQDSSQPT